MAGRPGEVVVIARISIEPDGQLNYFWEWYWRPTEIITEPAPGGHDLRGGAVMLEMMVVTSGAAMLSRLRSEGVPYPVAVMVALQVAFATGLALAMAGGSS